VSGCAEGGEGRSRDDTTLVRRTRRTFNDMTRIVAKSQFLTQDVVRAREREKDYDGERSTSDSLRKSATAIIGDGAETAEPDPRATREIDSAPAIS